MPRGETSDSTPSCRELSSLDSSFREQTLSFTGTAVEVIEVSPIRALGFELSSCLELSLPFLEKSRTDETVWQRLLRIFSLAGAPEPTLGLFDVKENFIGGEAPASPRGRCSSPPRCGGPFQGGERLAGNACFQWSFKHISCVCPRTQPDLVERVTCQTVCRSDLSEHKSSTDPEVIIIASRLTEAERNNQPSTA